MDQPAPQVPAGPVRGEWNPAWDSFPYDVAERILADAMNGVSPERSSLQYTPDMLSFRAQIEQELQSIPEEQRYIPADLPSTDVSAERGVAGSAPPARDESNINDLLSPTGDEEPDAIFDTADDAPDEGTDQADGTKPVDWYIDVDFPPIEQKDPLPYMQALVALSQLLPQGEESQRVYIGMALNALGVNDIDALLDRIFADLKKQQAMQGPDQNQWPMLPAPNAKMLQPGQPGAGSQNPRGGSGGGSPFSESMPVSPRRVSRILAVVKEATDALERVDDGRE